MNVILNQYLGNLRFKAGRSRLTRLSTRQDQPRAQHRDSTSTTNLQHSRQYPRMLSAYYASLTESLVLTKHKHNRTSPSPQSPDSHLPAMVDAPSLGLCPRSRPIFISSLVAWSPMSWWARHRKRCSTLTTGRYCIVSSEEDEFRNLTLSVCQFRVSFIASAISRAALSGCSGS
jgi:hypothetical protein